MTFDSGQAYYRVQMYDHSWSAVKVQIQGFAFPMEYPASAVQSARFQEVGDDIDRFLDPSFATSDVGLLGDELKATAACSSSKGEEEDLKEDMEGCQEQLKARSHPLQTRQVSEEHVQLETLEQDSRAKKRRISEMEDELTKLRQERDSLASELQEALEKCRQKGDQTVEGSETKDSLISSLQSQLLDSLKQSHSPKDDVLISRVSELEQEALHLRMLLKEACPEHELASQLRNKHIEFENQLGESQKTREDLLNAREKILSLEQDKISLQAAQEIQKTALEECKDAKTELARMRQDHALYEKSIADILASARQQADLPESLPPSPANLRLVWSRLHSYWTKEAHKVLDLQRQVCEGEDKQTRVKTEMKKLQVDLSLAELQQEELKEKLKESADFIQKLKAQNAVLREALAGKQVKEVNAFQDAFLQKEPSAANFEAQREAVETIKREAETLRQEVDRLTDVECKLRKMETVNAELWQANKELERKVIQTQNLDPEAQNDYDSRTTKILHLSRGPLGVLQEPASSCDLEQQQAARQLERYKKATKKYVSEFREGLYHLLGWKVEMRGDGSSLRWHLTSRYQDEVRQELVFQLRPGRSGQPAEFDLLGTPWAEQLQSDRQAMAFLDVYNSIPGFLAHVTIDRLAQQTFTR